MTNQMNRCILRWQQNFCSQKKLESELQNIEEKHEGKKRKFMEASEQFHEELKKVSIEKVIFQLFCLLIVSIVLSDL